MKLGKMFCVKEYPYHARKTLFRHEVKTSAFDRRVNPSAEGLTKFSVKLGLIS